jgi:toxin-antitoxin system PIN domain toxin
MLVDTNLLLYASFTHYPEHAVARRWLGELFAGGGRVGLPWQSLLGFLRVSTAPRVFERPMTVAASVGWIADWLSRDGVWIPHPGERHAEILGGLLRAVGQGGRLVHDAHLAALAIEHRLMLCSSDGGFARFPGLRWENPLQRL